MTRKAVEEKGITPEEALRVIGLLIGYVNWATGRRLMVVEYPSPRRKEKRK